MQYVHIPTVEWLLEYCCCTFASDTIWVSVKKASGADSGQHRFDWILDGSSVATHVPNIELVWQPECQKGQNSL